MQKECVLQHENMKMHWVSAFLKILEVSHISMILVLYDGNMMMMMMTMTITMVVVVVVVVWMVEWQQ